MRTKLRGAPTAEDLAKLETIHRDLQRLMIGMNPAAACHAPLFAAIATVQACGAEWSGNPSIWREVHTIHTNSAYRGEPRLT